jgi:hypothetical protein
MRHFSTCATICVLLVFAAALSAFGLNYNASKSNTGNIVLAYSPDRMTEAQAAAVLAELEKGGAAPDEATLRQILKKQGVQADGIQKIVKPGMVGDPRTIAKSYCFLLLEKPEDLATALQASQHPTSPASKK